MPMQNNEVDEYFSCIVLTYTQLFEVDSSIINLRCYNYVKTSEYGKIPSTFSVFHEFFRFAVYINFPLENML